MTQMASDLRTNCSRSATGRVAPLRRRRGVTLLETVLAIALSVIVLYLISVSINMNLDSLQRQQVAMEESQLARVLLRQIASDLRNVVFLSPSDQKALSGPSTSSSASSSAVQDGQSGTSGSSIGPANGPPQGSTGTSGPNGQPQSNASGTGGPNRSSSPGTGDNQPQDQEELLTTVPSGGLIGTQDFLQVDFSRVPRLDEYRGSTPSGAQTTARRDVQLEPPCDIRSVAYYLLESSGSVADGLADPGGLYRRELPRGVQRQMITRGDPTALAARAQQLAVEVYRIEFRYFDGVRWWNTWDSQSLGRIPEAVEVTLYLSTDPQVRRQSSGRAATGADDSDRRYRLVVTLPAAKLSGQGPSASGSAASGSELPSGNSSSSAGTL